MGISRRSALKAMAAGTATMVATTLGVHETQAAAVVARPDAVGILYDATRCIGCRYCQMGCPFNVPKFERSKAIPKVVKCELCRHRIAKG